MQAHPEDEWLFGWDPMPGIVSVWANRSGLAVVWRRESVSGEGRDSRVVRFTERFRPWLFATTLADVERLGSALVAEHRPGSGNAAVSYRELDGQEGSYRYLLSARDGRALERTLLAGASHRLGRQISNLNDLPEYYRVGPVEQYLMRNGRVYFRGLVYDDLHRLQFDLETTALDPHRGRIFLVAVRDTRGLATMLEAPRPEDEAQLIADLCALIRQRDPDIIENHNLFGFDLPFLEQRAAVHGLSLELGREGAPRKLERREETLAIGPEARKRVRYSVAGRELIDTLDAVRRHDFVVRDMPSYSLKAVARYFGMAAPDRVYLEGSAIFETYRHEPERVRHYALDDVVEVDGLSRRLLGAPFALAGMAPRRYERLASAGPAMGVLEPILVRAYLRAGAALPGPEQTAALATGAGMHEGGAVFLLAEGVAEHVVKADVASLYPSLMRTFQIGPSCDRLGVLLNILGRLTDLRLAHKAAAKSSTPGSLQANAHDATQAAMKILINAAYGYMGAGSMALFADIAAADEVTKRGRELLTRVLDALRERGMALIEADTDGVYFAVPPDWTEEQERALVAAIGAQLPDGIRLEYEGRYRAMFSHEVKNYALLTYDGQLIVHGVALRSSRAEPFGERFLRRALFCTMSDDIPGLRQSYLDMVQALRNRELAPSDLTTRVRLSKTPEAYRASRASHPEAQYEALLAAGRTRWFPGERVRFYRSRRGAYIWLPDENEEASVHRNWEAEGTAEPKQPKQSRERDNRGDRKRRLARPVRMQQRPRTHLLRMMNSATTMWSTTCKCSSPPTRRGCAKPSPPKTFEQLFRVDGQSGLFDRPIASISPRWICCS